MKINNLMRFYAEQGVFRGTCRCSEKYKPVLGGRCKKVPDIEALVRGFGLVPITYIEQP
jgi:hypothetical protein